MTAGRPPVIPNKIIQELTAQGGQVVGLFDLAYRKLGTDYKATRRALLQMEQSNDVSITRQENGLPWIISIIPAVILIITAIVPPNYNPGPWMALICCVLPVVIFTIGFLLGMRYSTKGISGLIPRLRRRRHE